MLAGIVLVSVLTGAVSLALSVIAGHPPVVWPFVYISAGICGMLAAVLIITARQNRSVPTLA